MKLNLIFAQAANGVIGKDGTMPWHLPEDLAHFKRLTQGWPVIMGRKTWDSLPPRFRPLPGRVNVVVTRQPDWQAEGAIAVHSLSAALASCAGHAQAWVIGGAQIYAQALPMADTVEITEIEASFDGDTFAPALGPQWQVSSRQAHVASSGLRYSFVTYTRV
ncbi:MAG: dihydrofolate reductase [Hylemonella sp.]